MCDIKARFSLALETGNIRYENIGFKFHSVNHYIKSVKLLKLMHFLAVHGIVPDFVYDYIVTHHRIQIFFGKDEEVAFETL